MNIKLIDGDFSKQDAIDVISILIQSKISYHENKIKSCVNEEDIKMREKLIIGLQNNLNSLRKDFLKSKKIKIKSEVSIG